MPNALALSAECSSHEKPIRCPKTVAAVRLVLNERAGCTLGSVTQLKPGTLIEICGEGYDDQTVKVRADRQTFFVFREDLAVPRQ